MFQFMTDTNSQSFYDNDDDDDNDDDNNNNNNNNNNSFLYSAIPRKKITKEIGYYVVSALYTLEVFLHFVLSVQKLRLLPGHG